MILPDNVDKEVFDVHLNAIRESLHDIKGSLGEVSLIREQVGELDKKVDKVDTKLTFHEESTRDSLNRINQYRLDVSNQVKLHGEQISGLRRDKNIIFLIGSMAWAGFLSWFKFKE